MGSINAQQTAFKVSETIASGKKVKMGEIILANGYTLTTSRKPSLVTNTKSYKQALEWSNRPLIDGLQTQISRIKQELAQRNLSKEEYRTLIGSLDIYIKNYQLLSGGATSRQIFCIPSEIMAKNNIETTKQD